MLIRDCLNLPSRNHAQMNNLSLAVTLVMNLCSLRNEPLTPFLTPPFDNTSTTFSLHPGTKSVLTLSTAFGGLISTFHGRLIDSMI